MHRSCLLFLLACQSPEVVDQAAPPPFDLDLTEPALTPGQPATWVVSNATPGATVYLVASEAGTGSGPCTPLLGGRCIDILPPLAVVASGPANAFGIATFTAGVPTDWSSVHMQAASVEGAGGVSSRLSPVRSLQVQQACRPTEGRQNVRDFGAVGDGVADDSPAFQAAMDCILDAARAGIVPGGHIYVPTGRYRFAGPVTGSVPGEVTVALSGDDAQLSMLISDNTDGILTLSTTQRSSRLAIDRLGFEAAIDNAGTAVRFEQPPGGNRHNRSLAIQDVLLRGANNSADGFFTVGVHATGTWRPLLRNVIMTGPFGPNGSRARRSDACFVLDEAYSPAVHQVRCWSADIGLSLNAATNPGPEGGTIAQSKFVAVGTGIRMINPVGIEPELWVVDNHINADDVGIDIQGRKFVIVRGNLMYNEQSAPVPNYVDVALDQTEYVEVQGNTFHAPQLEPEVDRVAIGISRSQHISVVGNTWRVPEMSDPAGTGSTVWGVTIDATSSAVTLRDVDSSVRVQDNGTATVIVP